MTRYEAVANPVLPGDPAVTHVRALPPPTASVRLPPEFPTFGRAGADTEADDPVDFLRNVENGLTAHAVDRDRDGVWVVYRQVDAALGTQMLQQLATGSARCHWRRVVLVFLRVAPPGFSPEEALYVLRNLRLGPATRVSQFVLQFETLRFRAGPRPRQDEAVTLFYRTLPRDLMLMIKASAGDVAGVNIDIWRVYATLLAEEANIPIVLAHDPEFRAAARQRLAKVAERFGRPEWRGNRSQVRPPRRDFAAVNQAAATAATPEPADAAEPLAVYSGDEGDDCNITDINQTTTDWPASPTATSSCWGDDYDDDLDDLVWANQVRASPAMTAESLAATKPAAELAAELTPELAEGTQLPPAVSWVQTTPRPRWILPVRITSGSNHCDVEAEVDSGSNHTLIARSTVNALGCIIRPLRGALAMADGHTLSRVGRCTVLLSTAKHAFVVRAEVFPGECNPPVLLGLDVIQQHGVGDLLSALAVRPDHVLTESPEEDLPDRARGDDSENREQFLEGLSGALAANAALDLRQACPLPEAVVRIPFHDEAVMERVYRRQPQFSPDQNAIVTRHIAELRENGFIRPAPAGCPYMSVIFLVPKKDADGHITDHRPV
ncbi:hypothetical protein IWQ56_002766, partial [Coemansia nantahalensis]